MGLKQKSTSRGGRGLQILKRPGIHAHRRFGCEDSLALHSELQTLHLMTVTDGARGPCLDALAEDEAGEAEVRGGAVGESDEQKRI